MHENDKIIIKWLPEFDLGIEEIDLQHHYFLNLINRLANALQTDAEHEKQVALIKELNAYVKFHFISEENLMRFEQYEQLAEHQRHHYELIDQLNARETGLTLRYDRDEALAVVEFLLRWFKQHTTGEDRRFADFLHRQRGG